MAGEPGELARRTRLVADLLDRWASPALLFDAGGGLRHANEAAAELFGAPAIAAGRFELLFEPCGARDELLPTTGVLARRPFQRMALEGARHGLEGQIAFCVTSDGDREQHVMEALAGMAGGVAHDFNNHLTAILSNVQLALASDDWAERRGRLEEIEGAALRARLLTQQLLAFSRGRVPRSGEVDLNEIVGRSRDALRAILGPAVTVTLALQPDLEPLRADASLLERALTDLARLMNVELLARRGHACTIATGRSDAPGWLEVRLTAHGTRFATRPGIAAHELAAVGRSLERCGGRLVVRDAGETVVLHLESVPTPRADAATEEAGGAQTILVAEDDDAVRSVVQAILERAGYRVQAAESGMAALERFGSLARVDLLVSDVRMPGLNGIELYRRLAVRQPGLRVLFMSGLVEDDSVRDTLSDPRFTFLQKPFTTKELLARVGSALSAGGVPASARLLVVDDDPDVLALIPRMLAGAGFECTTASSVDEALAALDRRAFDVVLCDVMMPDRDGFELLRELAVRHAGMAVVAMSGHKVAGPSLAAACGLGAVHALKKPFSRDELLFALGLARGARAA